MPVPQSVDNSSGHEDAEVFTIPHLYDRRTHSSRLVRVESCCTAILFSVHNVTAILHLPSCVEMVNGCRDGYTTYIVRAIVSHLASITHRAMYDTGTMGAAQECS